MNITVMLIILIIFIIILWIIGTINKINRLEVKISEANSSIDIALTKRDDVLTKMIATVKDTLIMRKILCLRLLIYAME